LWWSENEKGYTGVSGVHWVRKELLLCRCQLLFVIRNVSLSNLIRIVQIALQCLLWVVETCFLVDVLFFLGLVETDPEAALSGFAEVVRMEPEKGEW